MPSGGKVKKQDRRTMKTAQLKARFIGRDSLGYKHGKVYQLFVYDFDWFHKLINRWSIEVKRTDGTGFCPYRSLFTFLDNWEVIRNEKD